MTRKYRTAGLNCAHCAGLIADGVKALAQVKDCELALATQTLTVETDGNCDLKALDEQIAGIVTSIEDHVQVICLDAEDPIAREKEALARQKRAMREEIATMAGGAALFVIGLLCGGWVSTVLQALAYLALGYEVLLHAAKSLLKLDLDEQLLMALATLGALALGELTEACGVMLFYRVGEFLQDQAVSASRRRITSLMALRPDTAHLALESGLQETPASAVVPGDLIEVEPGERVPLDGVVCSGSSELDRSALTGESTPVAVAPGEEISSGSVNLTGVLRVRVSRPQSESAVQRILELTQSAVEQKATAERTLTRFARVYTPCVVALAILVTGIGGLASGEWRVWLYRSLLLLMLSCPCALVLSVPLTFFAGIGTASRRGVLFKGGQALESLARANRYAFDKTGTLTDGSLEIREVYAAPGHTRDEVLRAAALCEQHSAHPVARAIVAGAPSVAEEVTENAEEWAGEGVSCLYDCLEQLAGNGRLMKRFGIEVPPEAAGYPVHVAADGEYLGSIALTDHVRPEAGQVLDALRPAQIAMLTGDSESAARRTADLLAIDQVHAALLPEDKLRCVSAMRQDNAEGAVVFVGDGINDAPVLAAADVGVAMGAMGRDAAIEAADVVLMNDSLAGLLQARGIARKTMRLVRENVALALLAKLACMALGLCGLAGMWLAVLGDVGVALVCVLNSLRATATR